MRPPSDKALWEMHEYSRWSALEDIVRHYLRMTAEEAGPEMARETPLEPDALYGSHGDHITYALEEMIERLRDAADLLDTEVIARKQRIGKVRRLEALRETTGRTPEEVEAFRRKADELEARR